MLFQIAQSFTKYLGLFCKKICSQELSKIAQSGHNGCLNHSAKVCKVFRFRLPVFKFVCLAKFWGNLIERILLGIGTSGVKLFAASLKTDKIIIAGKEHFARHDVALTNLNLEKLAAEKYNYPPYTQFSVAEIH